jgi:mannose-6-phosphate isomerase-like protein (cupin superfamily)
MRNRLLSLIVALVLFLIGVPLQAASAAPLNVESQKIVVFQNEKDNKTITVGKQVFKFQHFTSSENGSFSTVEITTPSQYKSFLLEKHVVQVPEDFYAVSGEFEFFGNQPNTDLYVHTGDVVHIPAGFPYGFRTVGTESGKLLLITSSPTFESFIEEIGINETDPAKVMPISKIASVAQKYGIQFLN